VKERSSAAALPFAVYPNATNPEEAFSTDYSEEEIKNGRALVDNSIKETKANGDKLLLGTSCNPLFPREKELEGIIVAYGFSLVQVIFGGEILMYVCHDTGAVILLHGPSCIAGDSRQIIDMKRSILRGMTAAFLQGVVLHLTGKAHLEGDESPFENPLLAAFHFEVTRNGLHQSKMLGVVLFRDRVTPCDINAIERSKLPKCELPILTKNNRKRFYEWLQNRLMVRSKAEEFTGKLQEYLKKYGHCELFWAVDCFTFSLNTPTHTPPVSLPALEAMCQRSTRKTSNWANGSFISVNATTREDNERGTIFETQRTFFRVPRIYLI
jgi:hypothetical protein